MKKPFLILLIPLSSILLLSLLWSHVAATAPANPALASPAPFDAPQPINTKLFSFISLINTTMQMVVGPQGSTTCGDPYSPLSSPYHPGSYTYQYRIRIPDDYSHNVVRVEIFDPDSYNAIAGSFTISHTNLAIANGFPVTSSVSCPSSNRTNTCLADTGEVTLTNSLPGTDLYSINLHWIKRVDRNYPPSCSPTASYSDSYNTSTFYELFYLAEVATGTIHIPLVNYMGLPNNAHDTDLRWVSPGAPLSPDQTTLVPAGSDYTPTQDGFEITLDTDTPNMRVEPFTGDRYLYLSVTTVGGSSKNGFDIWAGPPDGAATEPSEVNARNLSLLNGPSNYYGLDIYAQEASPQTVHYTEPFTRSLRYFNSAFSGQPITLTLFGVYGGPTPLTVTVGGTALTYGISGTLDPDGVPAISRCFPECYNTFIAPSYVITLPGDPYCGDGDPSCTPFSGGDLQIFYASGENNNHLVSLTTPYIPLVDGCTGFPIAVHEGVRSVYPPNTFGDNRDYPNPGDFHPSSPQPLYTDFPSNVPDTPLQNAQEGTIYRVMLGTNTGEFSWLRWNTGINGGLIQSMIWPGNTNDYADHGDGGQPATPLYNHVVRGYVNPYDTSDLALNPYDWVAVNTGAVHSAGLLNIVNDHINNGRILRLLTWGGNPVGQGQNTLFEVLGFANFRIQGHNLASSASDSWLLLEFVSWDFTCFTIGGPTNVQLHSPTAVTLTPSPIWLFVLVLLGMATAVILSTSLAQNAHQP